MAIRVLNLRDTVFRILDQTTNTPLGLTCPFVDGTLTLPVGPPRPADEYVSNQGKADANHHWVIGDDADTFAPLEATITFLLESTTNSTKVLQAMSNPMNESPWQPNATAFVPATTLGARYNADGTSVTCIKPADKVKADGLVHVEFLATNPDGGGTDYGCRLQGVYFTPPQLSLGNPRGTMESTMLIYGEIVELTALAFTAIVAQ